MNEIHPSLAFKLLLFPHSDSPLHVCLSSLTRYRFVFRIVPKSYVNVVFQNNRKIISVLCTHDGLWMMTLEIFTLWHQFSSTFIVTILALHASESQTNRYVSKAFKTQMHFDVCGFCDEINLQPSASLFVFLIIVSRSHLFVAPYPGTDKSHERTSMRIQNLTKLTKYKSTNQTLSKHWVSPKWAALRWAKFAYKYICICVYIRQMFSGPGAVRWC